jgi:hypothetical protein
MTSALGWGVDALRGTGWSGLAARGAEAVGGVQANPRATAPMTICHARTLLRTGHLREAPEPQHQADRLARIVAQRII